MLLAERPDLLDEAHQLAFRPRNHNRVIARADGDSAMNADQTTIDLIDHGMLGRHVGRISLLRRVKVHQRYPLVPVGTALQAYNITLIGPEV